MKIAISTSGNNLDEQLDVRFGRCKYFMIYDTETKTFNIIENEGQKASGGAGIAAAQQLIDEDIDAIITGSLGPNAFEIINKSGIKAYKSDSISIRNAIDKCEKGELEIITIAGPAHHGA